MQKFEYLATSFDAKDTKNKEAIPIKLNELGGQGWECFFVTTAVDLSHPQMREFHTFYFKRPAK